MRNIYVVTILITSLFVSCTNNDVNTVFNKHIIIPNELAFPEREKELITLSDGTVIEKLDSVYILGGDIILSQSQFDILVDNCDIDTKSSALNQYIKYWPGGKIYYQFENGFPLTNVVLQGMQMWTNISGIEFIQKTTGDRVLIKYVNDNSNSSNLGYLADGIQYIWLSSNMPGVVAHELGHTFGLIHEHQRSDRNQYIIVNNDNIQSDKIHNFNIVSQSLSLGTMDYNSIMMYGSYNSFAIDETIPIMTKINGTIWNSQRSYISSSDSDMAKYIYGPPFFKIVSTIIRDDSWWNQTIDVEDIEYSNQLFFYSDKQLSNRITTNNMRKVILRLYSRSREYGDPDQETYQDINLSINSGIYTHNLGNTTVFRQYELGNLTRYSTEEYQILFQ